jgi:hypothetical protein
MKNAKFSRIHQWNLRFELMLGCALRLVGKTIGVRVGMVALGVDKRMGWEVEKGVTEGRRFSLTVFERGWGLESVGRIGFYACYWLVDGSGR